MIKRTLYSLLCIMVLFGVVSNFAYAEEVTQTINLNFPQKNEITQSQTIHVPNLLEVTNIDVDNGNVNYEINGDNVIVTATNGTPVQVQTGGEYIPAETKYVEGQTNQIIIKTVMLELLKNTYTQEVTHPPIPNM
ncbi:hypothetical protein [Robertmurraya kyonggiensis]|uniref:Uncharacterized protein n=1 Tax=Robertmurraya kyonggiensis TaxID=1037680 RepID=A0A4U1CYR9_9BACI|nr:hypothetical protein [Robertmurraya kyonggiensis]TKC15175.1 hypothetical protein FA727_20045 [Robertmurraya kyonggiensis]